MNWTTVRWTFLTVLALSPRLCFCQEASNSPDLLDSSIMKVEYKEIEQEAIRLAIELVQSRAAGKKDNAESLETQLKATLQSQFELRLKMQRVQLAEAAKKVETTRKRLDMRESKSEELVRKRMVELTHLATAQHGESMKQAEESREPNQITKKELTRLFGELIGFEFLFDQADEESTGVPIRVVEGGQAQSLGFLSDDRISAIDQWRVNSEADLGYVCNLWAVERLPEQTLIYAMRGNSPYVAKVPTRPLPARVSAIYLDVPFPKSPAPNAKQITTIPAETATSPLLETQEQVEEHLQKVAADREQLTNLFVKFRLTSRGQSLAQKRYSVWLNGRNKRADSQAFYAEGYRDEQVILTPNFSWFLNRASGESQLNKRNPDEPVGWGSLGTVPDVRKIGLVNWTIETLGSHEFLEDLQPENASRTFVRIADGEHGKYTIVQMDIDLDSKTSGDAWAQYELHPKFGNMPVRISSGWTELDEEGNATPNKYVISQDTEWKNFDGIWFPSRVQHNYRCNAIQRSDDHIMELINAEFEIEPYPAELFDLIDVVIDGRE